jgi:O-methyltransferase
MTSSTDDVYASAPPTPAVSDCAFYHVMDLPGVGVVGDQWDLRPGVDAYLGAQRFDARRVLEIGPASGFLTGELERRGASVVAVELGPETEWDVVPQDGLDVEQIARDRLEMMHRLRNAWWLTRELSGGHAQVHYGSAYTLPGALGRFDVSVMACILLHTRDPLRILQNCADRTDEALVIVERHFPELGNAPVARLVPTAENGIWDTWWDFTPELFVEFTRVLGFTDVEVTYHEQLFVGADREHGHVMPLFTVVARR